MSAGSHLINDHTVTYLEFCGIFANLHYIPDHFMSDHSRISSCCIFSMINSYIRSANACCTDFYQHVVFFIQNRFFHINDLQIIWFYNLYCFHLFYL